MASDAQPLGHRHKLARTNENTDAYMDRMLVAPEDTDACKDCLVYHPAGLRATNLLGHFEREIFREIFLLGVVNIDIVFVRTDGR